jgi:hypothetical protein
VTADTEHSSASRQAAVARWTSGACSELEFAIGAVESFVRSATDSTTCSLAVAADVTRALLSDHLDVSPASVCKVVCEGVMSTAGEVEVSQLVRGLVREFQGLRTSLSVEVPELYCANVVEWNVAGARKTYVQSAASTDTRTDVVLRDCCEVRIESPQPGRCGAVIGCSRSNIVMGPFAGHVLLDGCENCNICVAAASITIRNCSDVTLHLWSASRPVFTGDNRQFRLGPYNATLPGLLHNASLCGLWKRGPPLEGKSDDSEYKDAMVDIEALNQWYRPIVIDSSSEGGEREDSLLADAQHAKQLSVASNDIQRIEPAEFVMCKSCAIGEDETMLPIPGEYAAVVASRAEKARELHTGIRNAGLDVAQHSAVQIAVQNAFVVRSAPYAFENSLFSYVLVGDLQAWLDESGTLAKVSEKMRH